MTDAPTGIDAGIIRAPEARRAEAGPTREQALTAFNSSFAFFEAATELTPQQEAARERIREAKEKTLDRGRDSRRTTLVDAYGKRHHPVEYVPVDDLLEFLIGQAEKGDLPPEEKDEISENIRILNKVSKDYLRLPRRLDPLIFNAKVQDEYRRIQKDPRLTSGDDLQDYEQAAANINKRRELILPKEKASGTTPAPESVPADGTAIALAAETASIEGLASAPVSAEILPPVVFATLPQPVQDRLLELVAEGHSDEEIVQILRGEGIDLRSAVRLSDTPTPEPELVPVKTALPEPAEATEEPIEITDFRLGMNFIDISSGDMVYVSNIHEKSHVPELADLTENEVTLTNLRTGERQTIVREKLLEKIRNGEGFKPDPIEGRKYKDAKTGKILTAQTDFKDGRPRVDLVDEAGKIVGTGKRQGFDEAVASGDYEEVKPAPKPITPPPPTPTPIVSLTSPGALPAVAPALPPAPFAPVTPGVAPATPSPLPAPIETLTTDVPVAPEPTDDTEAEEAPIAPATVEEIREYSFLFASRNSDLTSNARTIGEKQLRDDLRWRLRDIVRPRTALRRIGIRLAENGVRHHYIERVRTLLIQSGNSYADINLSTSAANASTRRAEEYQAGLAKVEAIKQGEATAHTGLVQTIERGALRDVMMNSIILPAVRGDITDMARVQELLREFVINNQNDAQVQHVFGRNADQYGHLAEYFATDLLETARHIREDIAANRFSLNQIDNVVKIQFANAKWGAETDIEFSRVDRFIAEMQRRQKTGLIFNPAVIGAAFSIATTPFVLGRGISAIPLIGAIPGVYFAAARRSYDLKRDITEHRRERTYSEQVPGRAKRRQELERFAYQTTSVSELLNGGRASPVDEGKRIQSLGGDHRGLNQLLELDLGIEANREALTRRIAEIRTRLDFSSGFHVDLIAFDSQFQVEQGRLSLIEAVAKGTIVLKNSGVDENLIQERINEIKGQFTSDFIRDVRARERDFSGGNIIERVFTSYRAQQTLRAGAFGGAAGLAFGVLGQEGAAVLGRMAGLNIGQTVLENIAGVRPNMPSGETIRSTVKTLLTADTPLVDSRVGGHRVSIPQGTEWARGSDGKLNLQLKDGGKTLLEDVRFDKKGSIHFDKDSILADEVREGRGRISRKDVLGKNGLWKDAATDVDRREWYRYNTPGHYEQNELRLTTGKKGNAVILSLEGMGLGREHGLHPNPIDVKELRNKGFFISLGGHSDKPIWVPVGADGHMDGRVRLDPDDYKHFVKGPKGEKVFLGDIAKMVINQDALGKLKDGNIATELYGRRDVFSIANNGHNGAIEAGRLIRRDGQNVAQIFATILGSEEVPDQIRTVSPPTFEINPKDLTESTSIPGIEHPIDIPPIVLPFAPRHPLEKMETTEPAIPPWEYFGYPPEYGFGYPMTGEDSAVQYMNWLRGSGFFPTEASYVRNNDGKWVNIDGTEIRRDMNREKEAIENYLKKQNPNHLRMVKDYAGRFPEMSPECRVAVTIPAFNEGKNIYHTLEEWSNQRDRTGELIDRKIYEINIIVNGPKGYRRDNTISEIERFIQDNPDVRINFIDMEIPQEGGNIGLARKIISDITLQRSINRSGQTGPLYIESEDADLMEIDTRAVDRIVQKFDTEPYLDALRGKQDLSPTILMENDYLFFDRRVDRFVEYLLRDYRLKPDVNENYDFYWNRNITGGWNTAFTAEAYAMIGGYQPARVGEDVDIGRRISIMRGGKNQKGIFIPNVNSIDTVHNVGQSNPRRFILSLIKRVPAYHDFTSKKFNEEMRNRELTEMMSDLDFGRRIDATNVDKFEELLTRAHRFLGWKVTDAEMQEKLFDRLTLALGFKKYKETVGSDGSMVSESGMLGEKGLEWKPDYHINIDGSVSIDNIENIRIAFEEYRRNPKGQRTDLPETSTTPPLPTPPVPAPIPPPPPPTPGPTPTGGRLSTIITRGTGGLRSSIARPLSGLGARITRPRTTTPPVIPPAPPPAMPAPAPAEPDSLGALVDAPVILPATPTPTPPAPLTPVPEPVPTPEPTVIPTPEPIGEATHAPSDADESAARVTRDTEDSERRKAEDKALSDARVAQTERESRERLERDAALIPQTPPAAEQPVLETPPPAPITPSPALQTTTPPGPGSPKRITNDQALKRSVEILNAAQQRAKGWQPTSTLGKVARAGAIATTIGAKRKADIARLTGIVKPDNPPDDDSN